MKPLDIEKEEAMGFYGMIQSIDPYCGATTKPDASGCCEDCGGAVNG